MDSKDSKLSKALQTELPKDGWSPAHIAQAAEYLKNGDLARGSYLFSAPKEMVVNWIRARLAKLSMTTESDKVQAECLKTLLNDLNGAKDQTSLRFEVVIKDAGGNAAGVRIESESTNNPT